MGYSSSWKAHERNVAKALQGFRIPRGANFSRSLPDVVAESKHTLPGTNGVIVAECKYSYSNPWVNMIDKIYNDKPIIIRSKDLIREIICVELKDLYKLSSVTATTKSPVYTKEIPKYIRENLQQCRDYIPLVLNNPLNKVTIEAITNFTFGNAILPIVCIAEKGKRFRLCYTGLLDLEVFHQYKNDKDPGIF